MQIHELNNYNGNLDASSYLAVDNGNDTGKVSAQQLLLGTKTEIENLEAQLNARIDNIISGGTAPSEAEIIDARLDLYNWDYPSLGDSIRGQYSELKNALNAYEKYFAGLENPIDGISWTTGYAIASDGSTELNYEFHYSSLIPVDYSKQYTFVWYSLIDGFIRVHGYDEDGNWVELIDLFASGNSGLASKVLSSASSTVKYIRISIKHATLAFALFDKKTIDERLESITETIGEMSYSLADLTVSGSYIGSDGNTIDTTLAFARSEMIGVVNLKSVLIVRSPRISGGLAVAFYSENIFSDAYFLGGYEQNSVITNLTLTPPAGTKYIAFSSRTNEGAFSVELKFENLIKVIQDNAVTVEKLTVFPYEGEKLSILGDSISTYSGYCPPGNAMFYPKSWFSGVDNTWWKRLLTATKMELLVNNSYSGAHMAGSAASSGLSRSMSLDDGANDPDHVIVYMGVNDFANGNGVVGECGLNPSTYSVNNFSDAYYTALHNIKTKYPNARLYLGTIMQYAQDVTFPNKRHNVYLTEFNDAIYKLADIFGAKVIDFTKCGVDYFNQSTTLGDTLHPNVVGHDLMYKEALKQFK